MEIQTNVTTGRNIIIIMRRNKKPPKCARTECPNVNAIFWNTSTRAYYCSACAKRINRAVGFELCKAPDPETAPEDQLAFSEKDVSRGTGVKDEI